MTQEQVPFTVRGDTIVADLLERVPGALPYMISQGFAGLADPEHRRERTPFVTVEMAAINHSVDLGKLLRDLNELSRRGASNGHETETTAHGASEAVVLDVRQMPPWERHPRIFEMIDGLKPGQALQLVNDHEPKPLYYQIMAERPGQFDWESREEAPRHWVAVITRRGECCC